MIKLKVLFLCTQNSARSQMAEGLLRAMYGGRYEAFSAGTNPSSVNPFAVQVMAGAGIDISKHRSKSVDEFLGTPMDYVVTVCDNARKNCPFFPGARNTLHKSFDDPARYSGSDEAVRGEFRRVRDDIRQWLEKEFGAAGK
ncbi:MAG: arsenate reductase ArsC [Endomicrobiales bacterium]